MLLELLAKIPNASIGRVFGIPIILDGSLLILFLVTTTLITSLLWGLELNWSRFFSIFVSILLTLLYFVCLVLHELGHSLVAMRKQIGVTSITLFVFGGQAVIESDTKTAKDEFQIAIAGPIVSFLVAIIFALLYFILPFSIADPISISLQILTALNIWLVIFNLIPVFPSDGGRILRAFLWHKQKDQQKATISTIKLSKYISYLGVFYSVYLTVTGSILVGVKFGLISWFIIEIAKEELI